MKKIATIILLGAALASCTPKAIVVGRNSVLKDGKVYIQHLSDSNYMFEKVAFCPITETKSPTYLWELKELENGLKKDY